MRRALVALVVAQLVLVAAPAAGQGPGGKREKKEEARLARPKAPPLGTVNLVGFFGDAYGFLADLGVRVDRARQYAEATSLAAAAVELHLAERGAGKRAGEVTALGLVDEAFELAKGQKNVEAAGVVARAYELIGEAARGAAAAREAAALKSARDAVATRAPGDLLGFVRVFNHSAYTLRIHVWGTYMGSVGPNAVGATPVAEGAGTCAPLKALSVGGRGAAHTRACFDYRSQTINWHVR